MIPVAGSDKVLLMDSYDQIREGRRPVKGEKALLFTKCETEFIDELALIKYDALRAWVVGTFEALCPDTFWTQSASTTGKYHPRACVGEGGLVRHVRLAVWWGLRLAKALELEKYNDEAVTALLLHDVLKREDNVATHGLEMAHAIRERERRRCNKGDSCDGCLLGKISRDNSISVVTEGIRYHMGKWTQGGWKDAKYLDFCRLVHLADYCAAQRVDAKLEELSR